MSRSPQSPARDGGKKTGFLSALAASVLLACLSPAHHLTAQDEAAEQPESSPRALAVFSDAANFQNAREYELAATEWRSFLKQYADDPLAGKARYHLGVCLQKLDKPVEASAEFEKVIQDHPKLELVQDAYLNLGWCRYQSAQTGGDKAAYAEAEKTFAQLLSKYPDGKYADQGLFFQGESLYHQDKKPAAVVCYRQVVDDHPDSSLRRDAVYALGVTLEEVKEYAKAGEVYDLYLTEFSDSGLASEIRLRRAETTLQAGDVTAAEKMFADAAALPDFDRADMALLRQAYCLAKLEKFEQAGRTYAQLVERYPGSPSVAEATVSAGRCFYRANDRPLATKWLRATVDGNNPRRCEAAHWLCRLLLDESAPDKVVALVDEVLSGTDKPADDDPYLVHLKLDQADALYQLAEWKEESLEKYLRIVADHPDDPLAAQARYNAAFGAMELKKYDEAVRYADEFLAKHEGHALVPDVLYVQAECRLQRNQLVEAEQAFRDLDDKYPGHAEAAAWRLRLGLALYLQKKYDETIRTLGSPPASFEKKEQRAEASYLIGTSRFQLGQFAEALASLNESRAADDRWKQADEALIALARALHRLDRVDEAIERLRPFFEQYPASEHAAHAHYRLADFVYAKGEFEDAVKHYDAVLGDSPNSPYVPYSLYGKGWALLKSEKYEDAERVFDSLLKDHPEHAMAADAHFARGMVRRQLGKFQQSVADIDASLTMNPELPQKGEALYERGLAEVGLKKFEDAARTFRALLEAEPNLGYKDKVLYELAWALKSQGDEAKAVETFAELAAGNADSAYAAEAFFHVGEAKYEAGRFADAAAAYAEARDRSNRDDLTERSLYKLGWSKYRQEDHSAGLESFARQVDSFPRGRLFADGMFMKGECLFQLEKFDEALPVYEQAAKLPASSPQVEILILLHAGQSASRVKQWDVADRYLEQIPSRHSDSPLVAEAHYEMGWSHQNRNRPDDALVQYEKAATLSRGETGARARFMMGELLFAQKKHDEAILQFKRCMFGFGNENSAPPVKTWQAQSAFEAGRCAEVQIQGAEGQRRAGLIETAKGAYQYVLDRHAQHDLAEKARQRMSQLANL